MRKTKFLSALVVSALVGAVTLGSTSSTNAQTDIIIGDGSSSTNWHYGHMTSSDTDLYTSNTSQYGTNYSYTNWVGGLMDDTVTLDGGSLVLNHNLGTSHGRLYGNNGSLTLSGGNITLSRGDYIKNAVNLAVNSGATLRIDGSSVVLDSNDNISGMLEAENGTLDITSGTHNFGTGSTIANAVNLSVSSGATLGITGGSVAIGTGDTISGAINNSSGNLTFNSNTSVESLTNSNTSNTAVALGSNTLTVNNGLTNSGKIGDTSNTGSLVTKGTSSNTGSISVDSMTVSSGSFTNSGSINVTGELNNSSNFENSTNGTIDANAINNTAGIFTNKGTIGATTSLNTLNNSSGAKFDNQNTIHASIVTNEGDYQNSTGTSVLDAIVFNNTTSTSSFINNGTSTIGTLNNASSITGDSGSLIVTNGGYSSGSIVQDAINLTSGNFNNTGSITSKTTFTNGATITDNAGTGELHVKNGSSEGSITQNIVTIEGNFNNNASMTATDKLTNSGTFDTNGVVKADSMDNTGTFKNYTNGELTVNKTIVNFGENGLISNAGNILAETINNAAKVENFNGGSIIATDKLTNSGTFDTNGVVKADSMDNTGTFKNYTNGELTVNKTIANYGENGLISNAGNILAETINNAAKVENFNGGNITATGTLGNSGTFLTDGMVNANDLNNTGNFINYSNGVVSVNNILDNENSIVNDGIINTKTLTNNGTISNTAEGYGTLIVDNGESNGAVTQGIMSIATLFDNNAAMNIEKYLTNNGVLNNNSDITATNSTNDAMIYNNGTINTNADSTITTDKLTNDNGVINATKANIAVVYQSDDIKGIINVLGTDAATDKTDLSIKGSQPNFAGTMNIGSATDKATLNLKNGNIIEAAALNIASGSVLNVDDGGAIPAEIASVVLDSADTYAGDLTLASGAVTMKDLTVTTGATSTTAGGELPYYKQTGGALTLTNSKLSMVDSSLISGGDLTVDTNSTFNSLSKSFSVSNLTNAGLINGINGGYENYAVSTGFYAGDALGDKQGDFTTDLYARSNTNKNYDKYGSDSATIYASDPSNHGILNVSDWTLNGDIYGWDAPIDRNISMDKLFKGSVATGHTIDFTVTDKEVFTPIGWYGLHSKGGGNFSFDLNRYNPGVFRGQVSKIAQYQNQLMIDDILFSHTMLDQGFKGNDYIASNPNRFASATDLYPPYQYSRKDGGLWVKAYGTFENLQMNVGKIGNNAYGTIIGADFGLKELKHGWQFMPTVYITYNGAHQYWKGYGAYQNGGQAGFMGTFYKNNWIIGALAYGGVYNNNMDTPRGNDDTLGYFGGGAVKTAYNWNFAKDWSLQPNLLVSYNYFGKENWHTDFGQMSMMSGQLHGINIAPGLNLIWEKETFSIYGTIQYMYNVNQSVGGRAGNVYLPNVHMDRGYIQYGLGFNKRFGDRFNGFLQAVIRNVGRTGIGLQAGFQWQLGKAGTGEINDKTPKLKKTEIILHNQKIQ